MDALRDALAALSRDSRAPGLLVEQPARFETTRISQDTHQLVARVADGTGHRSQELEWAMGDWAREDSLHKAIEALEEHLEELETTIWDGLFAEIRDTATATTLAELGTSPESTTGGVRAIGFLVERCQTILDEAGAIELRLRDLKTRSRDLEERLSGRGTDQGLLRAGGSLYRAALPHSGLEVPTLPLDVRDTVLRRWLFAGLVGLVAGAVVLNVLGYLLVLQAPG